uniref:Uncharacterized protein n=1 Tax=Anopheles funestus TaxID=62324 RepID=A0A182R5B6_ANOFN
MRLITVVLWCLCAASSAKGYVLSRHKREVLIQSLDPSESDVHNGWYEVTSEDEDEARTLLTRKRNERKVLLELYYLAKVLRAYRRPWAFGSPVFKSALERITNQELLEQLERKLRREKGFEELSRIGTDGDVPDRMHVQLANDYRLLAPIVVRTLRKILTLKHGAGGLDISDKEDVIGELLRDQQREWQSLQHAVKSLKGDGVVAVNVPEQHIKAHKNPVFYEDNEIDVVHPAPEQVEVYQLPVEPVTESENVPQQGYQWADVKETEWEPQPIQWGPRPQAFDSETYYNLFPGYKPSSSLWATVYGPTDAGDVIEIGDTEVPVQHVLDEHEPVNLIDDQNEVFFEELEPEVVQAGEDPIPEDMVFESLSEKHEEPEPLSVQEEELYVSEEVTLPPLVNFAASDESSADTDGDIPEDMVVGQFLSGNLEEDEEKALDVSTDPATVDTEQPHEVNPEDIADIPEDMVFEALIDNKEDNVDAETETPWNNAEQEAPENVPEDIPEDMVLGALVDTTETPPYNFDEQQYANAPSDDIEGRRNNNRRRQHHQQQQQQVPVVIIQQTTTVSEVPPSASVLNEQIERAARELIAIELDKFLLLVEELSGVHGVSEEFDRADRTRMIGWVNQGFSPTIGLDQRDLVKAMFKLLNTKELSRGRIDLLAALEFLQSQLENEAREEKIAPKEVEPKEDDYFARNYGVNSEMAQDSFRNEEQDIASYLLLLVVFIHSVTEGFIISRRKREVLIQSIDPSESDAQNEWYEVTSEVEDESRTLLTRKRNERKVLLELYYLAKVLRAYRRPWAFGSPVFKSALERITNQELLEQLERKLRREKGFVELSRIGTDGTVPDQKQVQLANDYRLLAPILIRTLRRLWMVKKPVDDTNELIENLERDMKREWKGNQAIGLEVEYLKYDEQLGTEALPENMLLGTEVFPEHNSQQESTLVRILDNNESENEDWEEENVHPHEFQESREDSKISLQENNSGNEYLQAFNITDNDDSARSLLLPSSGEHFDFNRTGSEESQISDNISILIASEMDQFLLVIEELSGVAGLAAEFDPSDRSRMIDEVKQRYNASVGLDQRYFIEAVRTLLTVKQLYEGRFELLETLDYIQTQLDILEQTEKQDFDYP